MKFMILEKGMLSQDVCMKDIRPPVAGKLSGWHITYIAMELQVYSRLKIRRKNYRNVVVIPLKNCFVVVMRNIFGRQLKSVIRSIVFSTREDDYAENQIAGDDQ